MTRSILKRVGLATALAFTLPLAVAPAAEPAKQWQSDRTAFYGVWQIAQPADALTTAEGKAPPLLPEAAAAYAKTKAAKAKRDLSWDGVQQCKFHGAVRILYETMPFELLQDPKIIYLISQWNREYRMIHMNVEHSEPAGPQQMGQSVGKWEGDTLVVDTNAFDGETFLDASGLPTSDQLHLVERFSVAKDGKTMTARIRIEDPKVFSAPWETVATFRKLPAGTRLKEDTCVERLNLQQYK